MTKTPPAAAAEKLADGFLVRAEFRRDWWETVGGSDMLAAVMVLLGVATFVALIGFISLCDRV